MIGVARMISGLAIAIISVLGYLRDNPDEWKILTAKAWAEVDQSFYEIFSFVTLIELILRTLNPPDKYGAWKGLMASKHYCYIFMAYDNATIAAAKYYPKNVTCHYYVTSASRTGPVDPFPFLSSDQLAAFRKTNRGRYSKGKRSQSNARSQSKATLTQI